MKTNQLNVGQICSVKSCINARCHYYEYKKLKKIFYFWTRKEGYYSTISMDAGRVLTVEEIEAEGNFICKNEKVYYKPHLEIRMSNQNIYKKYFETEIELKEFMETKEMKEVNWINN